jgi:hypothetical protein
MQGRIPATHCRRPGKTSYRYLLGVKWSQVQILSAERMPLKQFSRGRTMSTSPQQSWTAEGS